MGRGWPEPDRAATTSCCCRSCDAPGTPVLEPGGLSMRDCQMIFRGLSGLDIIGGDVCEVSPDLDPGGITALSAANLVFELACLIAARPV